MDSQSINTNPYHTHDMQNSTETEGKSLNVSEQSLLKDLICIQIRDVLTVHDDGTIGFAAIDTEGRVVHLRYRLTADKTYALVVDK